MTNGPSRSRRAAHALLLTGAAATTLFIATGCATAKPRPARHPAAQASPSLPPADIGLGDVSPSPSSKGGSGGGGGQVSPSASQSGGTQIVYFRVKQQPKCASGTDVYTSPAVPAIIEWKVTGATKVALSVDNPELVGAYQTYDGTQGSETFNFSCGGPVGSTETHQYTINTVGGPGKQKMTISVSAKVLEKGTKVT